MSDLTLNDLGKMLEKRAKAIHRMTKEQRAALDEANHDLGEYVTLYNDTKAALDAALARERRLREAHTLDTGHEPEASSRLGFCRVCVAFEAKP